MTGDGRRATGDPRRQLLEQISRLRRWTSQTAPGADILPAKMDLTDRSQGATRWAMLSRWWALVTARNRNYT